MYPVIILVMDYKETISNGIMKANPGLNLVIAHRSEVKYNAEERDVHVFKKVLFPLYEGLMDLFKKSGSFHWDGWQGMPAHDKEDRPYYGTFISDQSSKSNQGTKKNIFSDTLDAIEISGLQIGLRIKKC